MTDQEQLPDCFEYHDEKTAKEAMFNVPFFIHNF